MEPVYLKHSEKLVLLLLAYEAGGGTVLTISKAQIAEKCNISKRTTDECIRQLSLKELISIHAHTLNRANMAHSYLLHVGVQS